MEVCNNIQELREKLDKCRLAGQIIGLVPTMGNLHEGHMQLVKSSLSQNDFTVCTIYINPVQFNNPSDLKNYPRTMDTDLELLEKLECDMVFAPDDKEIYPDKPVLNMDFGELGSVMEGKFRPGHFNGVAIVVSKLFNIVRPDKAYFGEKDLQQLMIIRQIVRDLNFGIEIVGIPIVREESGLAMSSRNNRLSKEKRADAAIIYKALQTGMDAIQSGDSMDNCRHKMLDRFSEQSSVEPEYIEFVDVDRMKLVNDFNETRRGSICTAAYIDGVRLIDNIIFELER